MNAKKANNDVILFIILLFYLFISILISDAKI